MVLTPISAWSQPHKKALEQMGADHGKAAIVMLKKDDAYARELAEELKQIVLHGSDPDSYRAKTVLMQGQATGALIDIYEALSGPMNPRAWGVLLSISIAGEEEGERFLQDMLDDNEPPKEACDDPHVPLASGEEQRPLEEQCPLRSEWCFAGRLLYEEFGTGPDPNVLFPLCTGKTKEEEDSKWLDP